MCSVLVLELFMSHGFLRLEFRVGLGLVYLGLASGWFSGWFGFWLDWFRIFWVGLRVGLGLA